MSTKQLQSPNKIRRASDPTETIVKTTTNWLFFWLVGGITIAKDLIDLALNAVAGATAATGVGLPISLLVIVVGFIMTLTVSAITMTYFVYTGQSVLLRFAITSICTLVGMLPIANILPEAMIGFFGGAFIKNISKVGKKVVSGVASMAKNTLLNR